jgi:peptidoglycan/LPS O-acetylase OafA/YrhL
MSSSSRLQVESALTPAAGARAIARPREVPRIPALDFTKGFLVLLMVLYHWVNYFIGPQWRYYEYLRFLTPSFIFISGFMISNIYLTKYSVSDPRLPKRLVTRGFKLLAVFVVLNLGRFVVVPVLGTGIVGKNQFDPSVLFAIFISGNIPASGSKLVSFPILVSISYLLILSGVLMYPMRLFRHAFHIACGLMLLLILALDLMGMRSFNLEFVTVGVMGVLAGFVPIDSVRKLVQHPLAVTMAYVAYLVAITKWNVPFPLLVIGVVLSVMVIFWVGDSGKQAGFVKKTVNLLGKYSLLGYIAQIAILQILGAGYHRLHLGAVMFAISFPAAFVLTIASVQVTDHLRGRAAGMDKLYKAVFA